MAVAKLTDATIHQSKKRYGGATILAGSTTIFQSFEDVHPKYGIMVEGARSRHLARRAECCRILCNNPEYRACKQVADMERHVIAHLDPEYREQGNEQRRNRRSDPEYREQENEQRRNRRSDPEYIKQENEQRRNWRSDPEYRARENEQQRNWHPDSEYREQENEQQRNRRSDPEYRARKNEQQCNRRTSTTYRTTYDMACTYKDGEFSFGQPCGKWSVPCVHSCGYFHLSSSTLGTRKKCCANGRMSISSKSCDSKLLAIFELRDFPLFM